MISTTNNSFSDTSMYVTSSTTLKTPATAHRCSSPRQFFEKLYGHLETPNSTTVAEPKANESPIQSDVSSSPGFLDERYTQMTNFI